MVHDLVRPAALLAVDELDARVLRNVAQNVRADMFMQASELRNHEPRQAANLRTNGSHDVEATDAFVPAERRFELDVRPASRHAVAHHGLFGIALHEALGRTFASGRIEHGHGEGSTRGPPLVLLHGLMENRRSFAPLPPHGCAYRQVFALDLRGERVAGVGAEHAHPRRRRRRPGR